MEITLHNILKLTISNLNLNCKSVNLTLKPEYDKNLESDNNKNVFAKLLNQVLVNMKIKSGLLVESKNFCDNNFIGIKGSATQMIKYL